LATLRAIGRDQSTTVVAVRGGEAFLNVDFPAAHSHNRLVISRPCPPAALADEAERVLGGAGLGHRLIEVHDPSLDGQLAAGLGKRGYDAGRTLVMAATRPPERRPSPVEVVELDLAERIAVARAGWRQEQPDWDDDVVDQLGRRIVTVLRAAQATFLAARGFDGSVAAHLDLYVRDGVAQIEEVMTDPGYRGGGLASALVLHAIERARTHGAELVFLLADAEDWPQHLYRRLGFTEVGRTTSYRRTAAER
jgi:ribosomal protein S18 acetylase RimI-like enzyme